MTERRNGPFQEVLTPGHVAPEQYSAAYAALQEYCDAGQENAALLAPEDTWMLAQQLQTVISANSSPTLSRPTNHENSAVLESILQARYVWHRANYPGRGQHLAAHVATTIEDTVSVLIIDDTHILEELSLPIGLATHEQRQGLLTRVTVAVGGGIFEQYHPFRPNPEGDLAVRDPSMTPAFVQSSSEVIRHTLLAARVPLSMDEPEETIPVEDFPEWLDGE
jgi:hypothetical protein